MKQLKSFAALALPAVATLSLSTPANAVLPPSTPATAEPTAVASYIYNKPENAIGIGVLKQFPGPVLYEGVLSAGQRTDTGLGWYLAAGVYIGPGYCADPYYFQRSAGGWKWYGVTFRGGSTGAKFATKTQISGESIARNEIRDLRPC
jgi:hypothetical protein